MGKPISATELRTNVYRILDRVLETGVPQEVVRNGRRILIVPEGRPRLRLEDLPQREALNCTFDELVETSWEHEWDPQS